MVISNDGVCSGLVVMRHGRREDTDNPMWQLHARFPFDTPLTSSETEIIEGAKQLQQAARRFDVIYTSPFLRCLETAERLMRYLGDTQVPVFVHRGLSEVHNTQLLFKSRHPSIFQRARLWLWRATYQRHSLSARKRFGRPAVILRKSSWPKLPETEAAAAARMRSVILELATRHPGQQVLVISHGKAVQVAFEALGCPGRVEQVGFAGFVACRPKLVTADPGSADTCHGGGSGSWSTLEKDPDLPLYNVDVQLPNLYGGGL